MTTYNLQLRPTTSTILAPTIADSSDGGWTFGGGYYQDNSFGIGAVPGAVNGNTRFVNLAIPQGATIISAVMNGWAYSAAPGSGREVRGRIKIEEADNATAIVSYADFNSRSWSTDYVTWNTLDVYGTWPIHVAIQSPDIKDLIQLIVNRAGWVSGNAIQIGWMDNSSDNTAVYIAVTPEVGYDGVSLDIEYSATGLAGTGEFVPSNFLDSSVRHPSTGQSFNLSMQQSSYAPTYGYILTESDLVITTESLSGLEIE